MPINKMGKRQISAEAQSTTESILMVKANQTVEADPVCALVIIADNWNNKSRMTRECHVRFCEGLTGWFRWSTRLAALWFAAQNIP